MIATIAKHFTFDAAHHLPTLPPDHKCYRMHGHTYQVELVLTGVVLDDGFVIDYAEIASKWDPLHKLLDHRVLNDVPGLEVPSTENLAAWIACRLIERDAKFARILDTVTVRESSTTWCSVRVGSLTDGDMNRYARR